MRILINDKEVVFPSSLSEITIGQRIAYHQQYGAELDKMLESIIAMEEGVDKELEAMQFHYEKMFRTFAFFANTTVDAIKDSKFIDDVGSVYYSCLAVLFEEEDTIDIKRSFVWMGEEWELSTPELKNGDRMKFGEFIDAKQVIKDMAGMAKGKWEQMLPLCAIYLRKKGEDYKEEFLYEGSERMELMKSLPMDIAMQVGFFLSGTLNFYISTLTSSKNQELKEEESTPRRTMNSMAG